MSLKLLLTISGFLEASAGVLAVIAPVLVAGVLLGTQPDITVAVLARFFGAGILSLGLAAVLARSHAESPAGLGCAYAMTCYNLVAALLLIWAAAVVGLGGMILWAAGIGHALLGLLFLRALIGIRTDGQ